MRSGILYTTAVFCLGLLCKTESCNVEIVATGNPSNITSPGYPNQVYPSNLNCWWKVVAANRDNNVVVEVVDSFIEASIACLSDHLTFYDGLNSSSPKIATICGTREGAFISTANSMYIQFTSDSTLSYKGFLLKIFETSKCGGELTATPNPAAFVSPGYPDKYFNNMRCTWVITAQNKNDTVVLEVLSSYIEDVSSCGHDSVTVYNGNVSKVNASLGTFCGYDKPSFQSSTNQLKVVFITNSVVMGRGFQMRYRSVPADLCNFTMNADSRPLYFVSPGYPDAVYKNLLCVWTIEAAALHSIRLDPITTNIKNSIDCDNASVTIYTGYMDKELGSLCGNSTSSYVSETSTMTVVFTTDETAIGKGFRIGYQSIVNAPTPSPNCGSRNLTAGPQWKYLQSPGYPIAYSNNEDCLWTIQAVDSSKMIRIVVLDSQLESDAGCTYDFVKVYDGRSKLSPLLQTWCGDMKPIVQSSRNYMYIEFKTDISNIFRGFRLKYFETSVPFNCGGRLTAVQTGTILTSPGYLGNYMNNLNCVWTISTSFTNIKVEVLQSNIEASLTCLFDYVKVNDGADTTSPLIGKFCGTQTPTIYSSGMTILITFHTDESNTDGGFELKYTGGKFPVWSNQNLDAGVISKYITSPNYPFNYPSNLDLMWTISTSLTNIKLDVLQSNIGTFSSCLFDYVKLNDGPDTSSNLIGKFCGTQTPTYYSSGMYVTLTFHTDDSDTMTGFKLEYTGGTFSMCSEQDLDAGVISKYITSPNYPFNYPSNMDCTWRIDAEDSDYIVSISVITSSLEDSVNCLNDYVEAFDGFDDSSTSLGRWCGDDLPDKKSSGEYMFIKFHTDSSVTDTGFKISYSSEININPDPDPDPDPVPDPDPDDYDDDSSNVGGIAGGTVGGIAVLAIICGICVVVNKSSRPAGSHGHTKGQVVGHLVHGMTSIINNN